MSKSQSLGSVLCALALAAVALTGVVSAAVGPTVVAADSPVASVSAPDDSQWG